MFLGGSRLASVFATVAGSQDGFAPRYAISSFDNPSFFVNNPDTIPADTMDGMVGIGFHPPQDVPDSELPFPTGDAETECVDIYADAGITFESRETARVALPYCDAVRLLKLGADGMATATRSTPRPGRRPSTATAAPSRPRPASATPSATAAARPPAATGCCSSTRPRATSCTRATRSPFDDE